MQRIIAASMLLSSLAYSTDVRAFVPDQSNVKAVLDVRPPQELALSPKRLSLTSVGDDSDGSVSFLGQTDLPRSPIAPLGGADSVSASVVQYFRNASGEPTLELKEVSRSDADGKTLVAYVQTFHGVNIAGTYAIAQVQGQSVRYARHYLVSLPKIDTVARINAARASDLAEQDASGFAKMAKARAVAPRLTIIFNGREPVLTWAVSVDTQEPYGNWTHYIDAQQGSVVTRHKSSLDAVSGEVTAPVEPSCQGDEPQQMPVPYVQWAAGHATNGNGQFTNSSDYTQSQVWFNGAYFRVYSYDNTLPYWNFNLAASPAFNELSLKDAPMSQTDPYFYVSQARAWVVGRANTLTSLANTPLYAWTSSQFPLKVNLPSGTYGFSCNAFYDGESLNFYQANSTYGCNNSGQAAKIVYHEYGHGIHDHLTAIPMTESSSTFDHQVSEGVADYVMATMTGDPNVTGLMGCKAILGGSYPGNTVRTCQNHYTYCKNSNKCWSYPGDEPHNSAPIMCGALWDLRSQLAARYGQDAGVLATDQMFLRFLTLATDMSSVYRAMIAADDDNDADPSNGTTHSCEINQAFLGATNNDFAHYPDLRSQRVPCVPSVQ